MLLVGNGSVCVSPLLLPLAVPGVTPVCGGDGVSGMGCQGAAAAALALGNGPWGSPAAEPGGHVWLLCAEVVKNHPCTTPEEAAQTSVSPGKDV